MWVWIVPVVLGYVNDPAPRRPPASTGSPARGIASALPEYVIAMAPVPTPVSRAVAVTLVLLTAAIHVTDAAAAPWFGGSWYFHWLRAGPGA